MNVVSSENPDEGASSFREGISPDNKRANERPRLSWNQKFEVLQECRKRNVRGGTKNLIEISAWAKHKLKLKKQPAYSTILNILKQSDIIESKAASTHRTMKSDLHVKSIDIENEMIAFVWDMSNRNVFLDGAVIIEKARRTQERRNALLPVHKRTNVKFTNGWLSRFKKRNAFKMYRSYGESGDVDEQVVRDEVPLLLTLLSAFRPQDRFNCDEFALFYKTPPTSTIGPRRLGGYKKKKERLTVLACTNSDGTEKITPLVIGNSLRPRCFEGREGWEYGFLYTANRRAWMNRLVFFHWLYLFDAYIAQTPGRRAILVLDNCSAHGDIETMPNLLNVVVLFLPKNTTSRLQPLDAGIIASVKTRYKHLKIQRAVDLIEQGVFEKNLRL